MGLELHGGDEFIIDYNHEIPILGRSVIARQSRLPNMDKRSVKTFLFNQSGEQIDETGHLLPTGNECPITGVFRTRSFTLTLTLIPSDDPEMLNRGTDGAGEITHTACGVHRGY